MAWAEGVQGMMRRRARVTAAVAGLLLMGASSLAHAAVGGADLVPVADVTGPTAPPFMPPLPHKTYQFDSKHWGFRLDLDQPPNRQTEWKDVTAGAYFKISPSIKLGGSVGLGDKFAQPQQISPQDTGPRVHLETKFQF